MTKYATAPPHRRGNEADEDQLRITRTNGDAYAQTLKSTAAKHGAALCGAGEYGVASVKEAAGVYERDGDRLIWRADAPDANGYGEDQ